MIDTEIVYKIAMAISMVLSGIAFGMSLERLLSKKDRR